MGFFYQLGLSLPSILFLLLRIIYFFGTGESLVVTGLNDCPCCRYVFLLLEQEEVTKNAIESKTKIKKSGVNFFMPVKSFRAVKLTFF